MVAEVVIVEVVNGREDIRIQFSESVLLPIAVACEYVHRQCCPTRYIFDKLLCLAFTLVLLGPPVRHNIPEMQACNIGI